jgi:outer membrane protein TolC
MIDGTLALRKAEKQPMRLRQINKRYLPLLLAIFFLISSAVMADDTPHPKALSLQECIETALNNNVDILTAQNNAIIAKSLFTNARKDYMP